MPSQPLHRLNRTLLLLQPATTAAFQSKRVTIIWMCLMQAAFELVSSPSVIDLLQFSRHHRAVRDRHTQQNSQPTTESNIQHKYSSCYTQQQLEQRVEHSTGLNGRWLHGMRMRMRMRMNQKAQKGSRNSLLVQKCHISSLLSLSFLHHRCLFPFPDLRIYIPFD